MPEEPKALVKRHAEGITHNTAGSIASNYIVQGVPSLISWITAQIAFVRGLDLHWVILLLLVVFAVTTFGINQLRQAMMRTSGTDAVLPPELGADHGECNRTIADLESAVKELRERSEAFGDITRLAKNSINQYVRILEYGIGSSGISETMPYLDLHFKLLNVSIFPVTIDEAVRGALRLNNKPMSGNIKVRASTREMVHNGEFKLNCRQWLSKEESNYILNEANDSEEFSFCDLDIMVRGVSAEHRITPQPLLVSWLKNKTIADLRRRENATNENLTDTAIEHAIYTHAGVMFQLLESERRLVFFIRVFNGLAHELRIEDRAEGFILLNSKPCHKKPEFSVATYKLPEQRFGRFSSLAFHQDVNEDEFNAIQKTFADGKSVSFDFDSVYVYVEVKGKRLRLRLPDGLSCKPGISYAEVQNLSTV